MRTCPVCSRQYEPPAQFCQVDGVALRIDAPSVDPYLGTKILEQFRLDRIIGAGGMGVVYEGWNDALSRRVAVKILHRDLVTNKDIVTRFHREAQIASQLDHPGIVRVILFGQLADGNLYLVLEFLEGPTLAEALEREGSFTPQRAIRTITQIADAIGYSHQKGIIHRDLKPENIVLTKRDGEEVPKVLDFGIAKMLVGAASFVTQSGLIFGTARYISPEGAAGEKVDQRSDVYSLGVMAYELMAGRAPFEADEPVQLLVKHMHEVPAPLRKWGPAMGVPPGVEDVVMRALAKNPDARHEDAAVFARALREALAEAQGAPVRSVIPTTAMAMVTHDARPMRAPNTLAPPESPVTAAPAPLPAEAAPAAVVHPTPVVNGSMRAGGNGAMVPAHGTNLPQREEFPVVDPRAMVSTPPAEAVTEPPPVRVVGSPATMAMPELIGGQVIPLDDDIQVSGLRSRRVTRPVSEDETGVPQRRSGALRAIGLVLLAAITASGVMVAGAWGLRMFPEQRRADNVAGLLRRATDAMRAERLTRATNRYSVEDITDDVLAIEADNVRARQLRRAAAVKLANSATIARNNHHPEQAIPLLEDALRLMDDATLRDDLATTRREVEAMRTPPVVAPAPRPRPAARPPAAAPTTAPAVSPPPGAPAPPAPAPTPPAAAAARRTASRVRNTTAPAPQTPEPGVTFTPGREPGDAQTAQTIPTPFGPLQINLPQAPPREPDPPAAPVDPAPGTAHTGEF
jgi:serine/threonine-protein kinase